MRPASTSPINASTWFPQTAFFCVKCTVSLSERKLVLRACRHILRPKLAHSTRRNIPKTCRTISRFAQFKPVIVNTASFHPCDASMSDWWIGSPFTHGGSRNASGSLTVNTLLRRCKRHSAALIYFIIWVNAMNRGSGGCLKHRLSGVSQGD